MLDVLIQFTIILIHLQILERDSKLKVLSEDFLHSEEEKNSLRDQVSYKASPHL